MPPAARPAQSPETTSKRHSDLEHEFVARVLAAVDAVAAAYFGLIGAEGLHYRQFRAPGGRQPPTLRSIVDIGAEEPRRGFAAAVERAEEFAGIARFKPYTPAVGHPVADSRRQVDHGSAFYLAIQAAFTFMCAENIAGQNH